MNPHGRPRKPVDEAKVARALELWRAGKFSFNAAARFAGVSREVLRTHTPEFDEWRAAKAADSRARYRRRLLNGLEDG